MNIIQAPSPNFTAGRRGRKIIAIVNHITAGLMPGTLSWLRNPAAKASAHYLITKKGEIYQLVADQDTAWHAGIVLKPNWPLYDGSNPNFYTMGIEHEALAGEGLTEAQYQATRLLHLALVVKHGIPVDQDHIIGHYRIDSVNRKNDPGAAFPWARLFADLKGEDEELRYQRLSDIPSGLRAPIETLMNAGIIAGDGSDKTGNNDVIDLSHDQVRTLIFIYRGGGFDKKLKAAGLKPVVNG